MKAFNELFSSKLALLEKRPLLKASFAIAATIALFLVSVKAGMSIGDALWK